jgi:endonuclease/exonuclease/phosphatase family metal-dependent hydrolase
MKYLILIFSFFSLLLGDTNLKITTYNVENLFDLEKKGYKYKEYKPFTKSLWNKKNYKIKLQNISKVIKDINPDIISLQEIHSKKALLDLRFTLKQKGLYYKYYSIADKKNTGTKVAILSKVPFVYSKEVVVTSSFKYRNILETKFIVNNKEFYLFSNHWKSKSGPESERIVSAKALIKRIKKIGFEKNIILLGDFNSDYEEYIKFKRKRKLNNTNGITGINHILNSIKTSKVGFYNLWYDTNVKNRYSYIYRGKKEALDNILVSQALINKKDMYYKKDSISNFSKKYLFKGKYIYRWQVSRARVKKHKGKGYSDHLAVSANFIVK